MLNSFMSYLGSTVTPGEAGNQFWALIYVLIIFTGVSVAVICMNWLERKALAHFQVRLGPMRVGPHGLLQPIADALKLMLKEDIIPAEADQFVFWIAPLIGALRSSAQMVSYEVAMGLAVVSAILMTSMNASGTGTLSMIGIVQAQQQQGVWFIFKFFPLGFIAFAIFAIAMVAETNRAPFDLAEAESELTAGFHTEYSGLRWSLFMLAEYAAMIAVSSIAVTLWLGGWMRPFPNLLHAPAWDFIFSLFPGITFGGLAAIAFIGTARMPSHSFFKIQRIGLAVFAALLGFLALLLLVIAVAGHSADASLAARFREGIDYVYWFVLKVAVFMYLFIWYRATWPRYRFDQLMKIGWKVMLPISIGVLMLTAIWALVEPPLWEWMRAHI